MKKFKSIFALLLALSLVLGMPFAVNAADAPKHIVVSADSRAVEGISIDGAITNSEWGAPLASYTAADCWKGDYVGDTYSAENWWHRWDYHHNIQDGRKDTSSLDIYVRRNSVGVYVGLRLNGATNLDTGCTNANSLASTAAHASIAVGNYDATTLCAQGTWEGETYEKFAHYTMGLLGGTEKAVVCKGKAATTNLSIDEADYAVAYDDAAKTYTYEILIRYSTTGGYVSSTGDLVMSFDVADASKDGKLDRYVISYAAYRYATVANTYNQTYFDKTVPLRVKFTEEYVGTAVGSMPATAPMLDGNVTAAEWGDPVIVTSPGHAYSTWTSGYWNNEAYNYDQKAKVYLTNDLQYIYMAVTVDHEADSVAFTGTNHWVFPKIGFMFAATNAAGTDISQAYVNNTYYDAYNAWDLRFDANGNPKVVNAKQQGTGDMAYTMSQDDVFAKYDPDTDTYTYEVRVPFSITNINIDNATKMAMSLHISVGHFNEDLTAENNRYNIGGVGWASMTGNTPFSGGKCLIMDLRKDFTTKERLAAGRTAALFEDIDMGDTPIVLNKGAYIDLNGHTLTVKYIRATQGDIIDGKDGVGGVVIPKNDTSDNSHLLELRAGNRDLPLYDEASGCYRFFYKYSVDHQTKTEGNVAKFGIMLTFENPDAYALLEDKTAADFDLSVTISSAEMSEDVPYSFKADTVADYATKRQSGDGKNWAIVLNVSGIENLTSGQSFTVSPAITSSTGAAPTATALTFTK